MQHHVWMITSCNGGFSMLSKAAYEIVWPAQLTLHVTQEYTDYAPVVNKLTRRIMSIVKTRPTNSQKLLRQALLWVMLLVCFGILAQMLPSLLKPEQLAADDFVEYWSAARLNLTRGNPYALDQMAALQTSVGRSDAPLMMWYLPWTLTLMMPFGLLPYLYARALWFILTICVVLACASCIWSYFGGSPEKAWIAWLISFLFAPTLQVIKVGQIGPVLLLGLVGFIYFEKRQKWWLAGASAALTTIKPHLLYLFLLAILVWCWRQKNWKVLAGMTLAVCVALSVSWAFNPSLVSQYLYAATHYPPSSYASAALGTVLRSLLGENKFWLQFVAPLIGSAWLLVYWWGRRTTWNWAEQISIVLLVSIATTAYGWTFDQSVLLIPMILVGVWCSQGGWSIRVALLYLPYLVINLLMLILKVYQNAYWWLGLGFFLWYLWAQGWFAKKNIFIQSFDRS